MITVLLQSCYNKNFVLSKRILTGFLDNGRKAEDRFELICECTSNEFSNNYWFSSIEELKTEKDKAWMILNEKVEKYELRMVDSPSVIRGDHHNTIQNDYFNSFDELTRKNKTVLLLLRKF